MTATRALTADGLPKIIADAALSLRWSMAASDLQPERAGTATGRLPEDVARPAVDPSSLTVLHTYWVAG